MRLSFIPCTIARRCAAWIEVWCKGLTQVNKKAIADPSRRNNSFLLNNKFTNRRIAYSETTIRGALCSGSLSWDAFLAARREGRFMDTSYKSVRRSFRFCTEPYSCNSFNNDTSTSAKSTISVLVVASALMALLGNWKSDGVNTADCA